MVSFPVIESSIPADLVRGRQTVAVFPAERPERVIGKRAHDNAIA